MMFKFFVCFVIEILHQTTTLQRLNRLSICCILLKFYIKPQQSPLAMCQRSRCILLKFYIKPQRGISWYGWVTGCILLKFYIKPQHRAVRVQRYRCCILLKFYIKPQQQVRLHLGPRGCILLKFYIKPQHVQHAVFCLHVVSY